MHDKHWDKQAMCDALGITDAVNKRFAGTLAADSPLKVGDFVTINGQQRRVLEVDGPNITVDDKPAFVTPITWEPPPRNRKQRRAAASIARRRARA